MDINASTVRRTATRAAIITVLGGGWWFSYGWLAADEGDSAWSSRRVNVEESQLAGIADDIIRQVTAATTQPAATPLKTTWFEWQRGLPELLSRRGYTVFVDFTGKYCLTCQVNKKVVMQTDPIMRKFREFGVVNLIADFTQTDPVIQKELNRFGRAGVPVNLLYAPGKPDSPHVFPEVLTQGTVLQQLEAAGASKARAGP
jgi:thiol:disulfide interchange protein DsbD